MHMATQVEAVKARGGMVRLVGESYTETQAYAFQAAADEGRAFVAPYDDPLTIAGQGTIGAEILKQLGSQVDKLDAIFVAIGGGGLIAGIAAYVRALKPSIKIIGVEPSGANCMAQSLAAGRRVQLSRVDAFADGVAVKSVGAVRLPQLANCVSAGFDVPHRAYSSCCSPTRPSDCCMHSLHYNFAACIIRVLRIRSTHNSIVIALMMFSGNVPIVSNALRWRVAC